MLKILQFNKDEYEFPSLLALGCFDAIHIGHRELIKKAKLQAKINGLDLGVMLFKDGKGGKTLSSFEERVAMLEEFNVKFVVCVEFDEAFKSIDSIEFLRMLEDKINVKAFMSGKDFRFGYKAKGKSSTLKNYADDEDSGVWYMPVKDKELDGEKVSATLIKSCLDEGNVKKAAALLGYGYNVSGVVEQGAQRGSGIIGFPTANITYPEWKYPVKYGVYSVKCFIDGTEYLGIANYGNCPTFGDERIALETYVDGYDGDLYGKTIKVEFADYIRDIREFASAEELAAQLKLDLVYALGETSEKSESVATEPETPEVVANAETEAPAEDISAPEVAAENSAAEAISEAEANEEITTTEEPVEPVEKTPACEETETTEACAEEVTEEVTEKVEAVEEAPATEEAEATEACAEEVNEEVTETIEEIEENPATEAEEESVVEEAAENPENEKEDIDGD